MRRAVKLTAVAAAAFAAVVMARFPARWAAGALPRGTTCASISGTLWSGACAGLAELGSPVGDLTWALHPLRLLMGSLSADVALSRGSGSAHAQVDIGPTGSLTAHGIQAEVPLDRALFAELPPGVHGRAQADIAYLQYKSSRITALRGRIDVRGLTVARGEPLGDFRLTFPAGGSSAGSGASGPGSAGAAAGGPVGHLTDLGGPLSVEGTVRLTPEPGYVIDAQVAARPGAPPDVVNALRFLGSPDAAGRRPFSLAGSF